MKYKYVKTNMGLIPLEDYLDIRAASFGYDSYEELEKAGYMISVRPEEIVEKDE